MFNLTSASTIRAQHSLYLISFNEHTIHKIVNNKISVDLFKITFLCVFCALTPIIMLTKSNATNSLFLVRDAFCKYKFRRTGYSLFLITFPSFLKIVSIYRILIAIGSMSEFWILHLCI